MRPDPAHPCICSGLKQYMNRTDVQEILGADVPFVLCGAGMDPGFRSSGDFHHPMVKYNIAALLERGVRTLIYAGANDFACPWVRTAAKIRVCIDR